MLGRWQVGLHASSLMGTCVFSAQSWRFLPLPMLRGPQLNMGVPVWVQTHTPVYCLYLNAPAPVTACGWHCPGGTSIIGLMNCELWAESSRPEEVY